MSEPLLALEAARIDAGGAVLLDAISFRSQGSALGLVGAWEPLFAVLAGRARVTSGSARIHGRDPRTAVAESRVGLALSDAVLPDAWTAFDYLAQSAELAGAAPRAARTEAKRALAELGMAHLEARRLSTLTLAERRVLLVAHTTLGSPESIALEAPLSGLDTRGAEQVVDAIARASAGRGVLIGVPSPAPVGPERALLDRLGEVAVIESGLLIAQGAPGEALRSDARYAVTVTRQGPELRARLAEIGVEAALSPSAGGSTRARLVVELAPGKTTDDVFDAALAVGAPIVELLPLERAPQGALPG